MPYENEFARYEPLRRIIDNPKVNALQKRLKKRKIDEIDDGKDLFQKYVIDKSNVPSNFIPDYVIAIDGSWHSAKVENGFPGAEIGYITTSAVIIVEKDVRKFAKQDFIDPKKFRETEKASSFDIVIPGCNVVVDNEGSAKESMRKVLFEMLGQERAFEEGESLLETFEYLLGKRMAESHSYPKSPIDDLAEDTAMEYGIGEYVCQHSKKPLYSTDALRLHELMKDGGSNGEMYGQIMVMMEKLWLINILRSFEAKVWLHILDKIAFVMDGPLACFSTWSWLNPFIIGEIHRINELQKKKTNKDLLIFGVEKSGAFCNHFEEIDAGAYDVDVPFKEQSALLLTDEYIKKNIIFSDSKKQYGKDTYFGRKIFYKTRTGYKIVPSLAFLNAEQQNLARANKTQFPRLGDLLNVLDELISSRYPNSISPLVSAHAEASIPLNLGKQIFDNIARKIGKQ